MSNGEVKRWTLENHGGELFSSPIIDTYEEVVASADHERIIAELKTVVEQKDAVVAAAEAMACIVREKEKTIAMQRRVIEKLKQAHEKNASEDFRGNRSTESVRSFKVLKEVETIEKGEA